jgi:hypothetical protein
MSLFTSPPKPDFQTPWLNLVRRKEESADFDERRSIFLGLDMDTQAPICMPRRAIDSAHYHVLGMTRAGKTSAALMPLVFQVLRGHRDEAGAPAPPCPVVIFDLKGDQAFFNAVWDAALRAGRRFRFFSTRANDDYHFFDPFQMFGLGHMAPIQLATEFIRAFSLDYGLIYGGLYFTQQNLVVLLESLKEMIARPTAPTIGDLARILTRIGRSAHNADARHVEACLKLLAEYPQVNVASHASPPHQRIDMLRALEDAEVVYFFLEMEDQAPSLRQVASLALYTLVQAAKYRYRQGLPHRQTYVVIDEFYHIAGKSFGELMSTVADWGLHFVLANQSRRQLLNHDPSLPDVVSTNTSVQQIFSLSPEDEEIFQKAAGETRDYLSSFGVDGFGGWRVGSSQFVTSRLSDQQLKEVNDTNLASLVLIQDGVRHAPARRVLRVQGLYPLPLEAYQRFRSTPLPQLPPRDDFAATTASRAPHHEPKQSSPMQSAAMDQLDERLRQKWQELERDELPHDD